MLCRINSPTDVPYSDEIPGVNWDVDPYAHPGKLIFEFTHPTLSAILLTRISTVNRQTPFSVALGLLDGGVVSRWKIDKSIIGSALFDGYEGNTPWMRRAEIRVDLYDYVENRQPLSHKIYVESYPPHKHWVLSSNTCGIYVRLEDGWENPEPTDRPTSWDRLTREDGTEIVRPGVG